MCKSYPLVPPYVVHGIDTEIVERAAILVPGRETWIGLFDATRKIHIQKETWPSKLDNPSACVNIVTSSALANCWSHNVACYLFSLVVALLLRDGTVSLEEHLNLHP